ncbi:phage integrase [Photobacterium angustum]|uniref:Integrase n=1 Tax=Photobacterium angustum TaxID=661 RepID=A0A855SF59_PHOAN|nr:tyrosine-type recombinase/integrase [Photobacterium angustum]KJF83581.1 recombinase [Photobacterium damselae subsp. damselae]KJG42554.1 recombinase [Photobacterium angustum]KJG47889.1 recombinase [Photobacterium angustum]KJG49853.1 recombinase [Photobacterium angustum]KJG54054.1 recombinase [Photobacterium angustum]
MAIRNLKDGSKKPWLCECYPSGRNGKRIRKRFATKGEAAAFERFTLTEVDDKPWLGEKDDNRRLLDLVNIWHSRHGSSLAKASETLRKLELITEGMGNPLAKNVTAKLFSEYREARLNGDNTNPNSNNKPISKRTCNYELTILGSVFSELIRLGEWKLAHPLTTVRPFRLHQQEMAYLTQEQIRHLLTVAAEHKNKDLIPIIKICLATGARFSEVESLTGSQLSKYKITFIKTKGKKNRTIPISIDLYNDIYKPCTGRLFQDSYKAVYRLLEKHFPELPKGQSSHVFRHTFASHFMMNGGNILVLQRILGHSNINQTMQYSHFAPDHLEDAILKNPLVNL